MHRNPDNETKQNLICNFTYMCVLNISEGKSVGTCPKYSISVT